jgi:hypothetical protein
MMHRTALLAGLALFWLAAGSAAAGERAPSGNPNYHPPPAKEGFTYPDCYCTDSNGKRVELGQTACLTIGSRRVLARCGMSVNNPIWRDEAEGCPGV